MDQCNCAAISKSFHVLTTPLLMYLDGLKFCQCKEELRVECTETSYNWTLYHNLVYSKICDPDHFESVCKTSDHEISNELSLKCTQIVEYKRGVAYNEWFVPWSPFCPVYGFGASQEVYENNPSVATPYNNMAAFCQRASLFAISIFFLLSMMIIIANVTVLLVVRSDQYFHTPYGYFKASIALADLCVGLLVIPFLIYIFYQETFSPKPFITPGQFQNLIKDHKRPYLNVAGFFTIFSLSISVYCLAASSLDRYFSIARPFHYNAKKLFTQTRSLVIIVIIWILATIYSLFPFMSSSVTYSMVSATFVLAAQQPTQRIHTNTFDWLSVFSMTSSSTLDDFTLSSLNATTTRPATLAYTKDESEPPTNPSIQSSSDAAMYVTLSLYLLFLIIPLVIVWTVNICTVRAYRKNQKKRLGKPSLRKKTSSFNSSDVITPLPPPLVSLSAEKEKETNLSKLEEEKQTAVGSSTTDPPNSNKLFPVPRSAIKLKAPSPNSASRPNSANSDIYFNFTSSSVARVWARKSRMPSKKKISSGVSRKLQKVLLRMVMAFTITLLPSICALIMYIMLAPYTDVVNNPMHYSVEVKLSQNSFFYICSVLLFGNSFVNCIIYTVLGKRFRKVSRRIYAGKIKATREAIRRVSSALDSFSMRSNKSRTVKPTINIDLL